MHNGWNRMLDNYEGCIVRQKQVIAVYRAALNREIKHGNFTEIERLNRVLRVLYEEKSELEERAAGLKEYLLCCS